MARMKSQNDAGNFLHYGPGFNFRMSNIHAAIGVAQLQDIDEIIRRKKNIAHYYRTHLSDKFHKYIPSCDSSEWMPLFALPPGTNFEHFKQYLLSNKIDVRGGFRPLTQMAEHYTLPNNYDGPFWKIKTAKPAVGFKSIIFKDNNKIFNLPCYPTLCEAKLEYICKIVNGFFA